ncbi:ribose-phosphate pyrophosphokinase [Gluconacetobacter johannae DSM 13595]|uniref:ribose-phosphate diphosphokinase n=1 Tax=Gluconacetobacter johannae TaxID=112140 RepID=UPI0021568582|nr:ribose-phosphate diphosphokinase [Gluconacetobacter johannae]GBQ85980.1 ribose-phosphate pyrophosphokinase [Gluconacetobacter johannae DSM 13595]
MDPRQARPGRQADPLAEGDIRLFALAGTDVLGQAIARHLDLALSRHEERDFEDGEHKTRALDPVCGADVYLLHSLHGDAAGSANDRLCRLLFFIGACKDAGAARVTAIAPYLCYGRKDRRTKPNDPVTTRYVATLFEAVGTDRLVTMDVHDEAAFENAFRRRTVALTAVPLLVASIRSLTADAGRLCVVSPDLGGGKRAERLRGALEEATGRPVGTAFAEKHRSGGQVSGDLFVGDVQGATCIVIDDLVSTGGTLARAARAARDGGARQVVACVTHGLFAAGADTVLAEPAIDRILTTDTVQPIRLPDGPVRRKLEVVSAAPLLAEAIRRLHRNVPLSDLFVF